MPTALANNAAAVTAGYKQIQIDRGAGKSPRFICRHEKSLTGEPNAGSGPPIIAFEGTDDAAQATADANALASINAWRNNRYGLAATAPTNIGAATVTAATPAVVTRAAHGLVDGDVVQFTTTTTLPTGLALLTNYYVTVIDSGTFWVSALPDRAARVACSDTGTGTHTVNSRALPNRGSKGLKMLVVDQD